MSPATRRSSTACGRSATARDSLTDGSSPAWGPSIDPGPSRGCEDSCSRGPSNARHCPTASTARRSTSCPSKLGFLKLGEESGGLEENLGLLGRYFETEHKRMLWVKKKMSYPMMNVLAGIGIAPFPVLFFGDAVRYFTTVGIELVLAMAFGGALLRIVARRYRNRPKVARARLCRALAIAVEAGLPMDLGVQAADDASLTEHLARLPAAARANQTLADTLAGWSRLTPDMQQVLGVADQTGDYTNTLKRLADLYDDGF